MGRLLGTMRRAAMTGALGAVIAGTGQVAPSSAQSPPPAPPAEGQSAASLPEVRVTARRTRQRARTPAPQQQAAPSAPVEVETANGPVRGYVAGQSGTATKTDAPILTTPQSISVVTQDQIATQQAQTMNEALRYTPGVITDLYGASSSSNDIKVRGFLVPRYLDGLRLPIDPILTFAQTRIEPWGLERIEVLKGPSSGLYGETSPGGLISMVSKRPTPYAQNQIELQTGSFGRAQGAFDFSGPLDKDKEFLYRFVGLARLSDTWIDYNTDDRLYLAPSFTWRPTNDTSFTVLASYTKDQVKGQPQQYVPAVGTLFPSPLGRIPYSRYLGEPNYDRTNGESAMIGYAFEHRFNNALQFRQNLRYGETTSDVTSLRNETGDPTNDPRFPGLPAGYVERSANVVKARSNSFTVDNQLQADFSTGALTHKVLVGVDYIQAKSDAFYSASGFFLGNGTIPVGTFYPINVYAPVYGQVSPDPSTFFTFFNQTSRQSQLGVYAQDEIKFDRFSLTLTGRHDDWQADTVDHLGFTTTHQNDRAWTGRAGLSYLFDNGLAPYVSYSTSFQPVVGIVRTGASGPFKPTTGEGQEVGVKFQPPGTKALFTLAAFDVTQQNMLTADPGNPQFSIQTGEVRVKGIEMDVKASLSNEIDIVGGYTHLEPVVTSSGTGNVGKDVVNIPRDYASLWGFYTFRSGPAAGLGLGAGVRYIGSSFADEQNLISVPSYGLVDAAISYDFSYYRPDLKGLKLQVNATNLFDKYYVSTCFTGLAYCGLGAPRRILATLKYSWN